MSKIKAFLKSSGIHLTLLAFLLAATAVGILSFRNAVHNIINPDTEENEGTILQQEETPWNEEDTTVSRSVTDLPEEETAETSKSSVLSSNGSSSSGADTASGSGADGQDGSATSSALSATVQPSLWDNRPVQAYSGQELTYNGTLKDWRTHNGADYAAELGEEVPALKAGSVLQVYQDALWGGVIELSDRDGHLWKYCGVTDVQIKQDDKVAAGQILGKVGEIPSEAWLAPHVHLECTAEEVYQNPESLMQ